MSDRVRAFLRLTRPVFLLGGALLYAIGAALARSTGASIDAGRYLLGQAMVTTVQLTAQYANEYFDQTTDGHPASRRTWLTGGSGALQAGHLRPTVARTAARAAGTASLAFILGVTFVAPAAGIVGILALAGSWAYSAPPLRLVATPWGAVVASVIVAGLTPTAGMLVQGVWAARTALAAAVPLVSIHVAMLIVFERPDEAADRATGKTTLTVRLGTRRAATVHDLALVGGFGWLVLVSPGMGLPEAAVWWATAGIVPAIWQLTGARSRSAAIQVTGAAAVVVVTAGGMLAGLA